MTDTPTYPPRRRGAPLRNLNALKHRISRKRPENRRRPASLEDLADCKFTGLKEEMTTPPRQSLHAQRHRTTWVHPVQRRHPGRIHRSPWLAGLPVACWLAGLPVAMAAASLTRLARTQKFLDGSGQTLAGLSELLAQVDEQQRREGVHE